MENSADFITLNGHRHIAHSTDRFSAAVMCDRSRAFYEEMDRRRSVRDFSTEAVPKEVIENIIKTASSAPSGAHLQPWTFCAISNAGLKHRIRIAAEAEEKINYETRMSERWKKDLERLGTDMNKPFLDDAPWLIVVFKKVYDFLDDGEKRNNYYVNESVGIACGLLISAIHHAGLVALTHTPSPMNFLEKLLERPVNERAFLLLPVGYSASPAYVPELRRKSLEEVAIFWE